MPKSKNSLLILIPLFMVVILDVMGVILVLPVLTPLLLKPGTGILSPHISLILRDMIYGITLAIFPLFMFLSTPILGDLSDKFGRKKILLACLIASTISYLIAVVGIFTSSLFIFLISRAIAGLAAGTQPIATAAIIDISTPETKSRNLSWIVLASSIGIIIGPLFGGFTAEKDLMSWFGFETPFVIAAVLSIINAIYLLVTFIETNPPKSNQAVSLTKGFVLFLAAFSKNKFRLLSLTYFCALLAWGLYFLTISWYFMEVFHYSVAKIGLFIGFIGVVFSIALTIGVRFVSNFFVKEINAFLCSVILMAIANIGAAISHTELAQWLWVIVNATTDAICYTILLSIFSNSADQESQGWIMGVAGAIAAIAWTVGSLISGPLGFIDIHLPFWTAGILCLVSFGIMLIYKKHVKS